MNKVDSSGWLTRLDFCSRHPTVEGAWGLAITPPVESKVQVYDDDYTQVSNDGQVLDFH